MKNFTLFQLLFYRPLVNTQAAVKNNCMHFTSTIPVSPKCHSEPAPFPQCFSSKFIGNLVGTPVLATTNSGRTQNDLAEYNLANHLPDITAATALTINKLNSNINNYTPGRNLGTVKIGLAKSTP